MRKNIRGWFKLEEDRKEENKKKLFTQEDIMKVLNNCYEKALMVYQK